METIVTLNRIGQAFVDFASPMLIQSSVLILILLAVDLAIRRRVRAVVRYCLWMLVLVKLVLPTSLALPTGIGNGIGSMIDLSPVPPAAMPSEKPAPVETAFLSPRPDLSTPEPVVPQADAGNVLSAPVPAAAVPTTPMTWQAAVFLAWLATLAIMAGRVIQRYFFVRDLVAQARPADEELTRLAARCAQGMKMRRCPELRLSGAMVSPAACGLVRPVILMPDSLPANLAPEHLRAVLFHELAHIRRGDLWVNLAQTILQSIYFYNPLLWLANAVIRRIREQAVDETVLTKTVARGEWSGNRNEKSEDQEAAGRYAEALVSVARLALARPALSLRLIGVVESKSALTQRIKHILSRPLPKSARLGIVGLLGVFILAAILLPMAEAKTDGAWIDGLIGQWSAQARIIVNWTRQKQMNVTLTVNADGSVTGRIGDAELQRGRLKLNRGWMGKQLHLATDYIITGKLAGPVIAAEDIRRDGVNIPLNLKNGQLVGSVHTTGSKFGGKERMILTANLALERQQSANPETDRDGKPSDPTAAAKPADPKFAVTLPDNITVELVGVSHNPSRGMPWWKPDGSPLTEIPYDKIHGKVFAHNGEKPREVAVRVGNLPADASTAWNTPYGSAGGYVPPQDKDGRQITDLRAIALLAPRDRDRITFRVGVATGPWKTLEQFSGTGSGSRSSTAGEFAYSEPYEKDNATAITISDSAGDEVAYRIVAVDHQGQVHLAARCNGASAGNLRQTTAEFQGLPLDSIREFQFQTRPYEWVTFRNVSVEPGKRTKVEVHSSGAVRVDQPESPKVDQGTSGPHSPGSGETTTPLPDNVSQEQPYELGTSATLVLERDREIRLACKPNKYVTDIVLRRVSRSPAAAADDDALIICLTMKDGKVNKRGPMRKAFRIVASDPGFAEIVSWDIRGGKMTVEYRTETDPRKWAKEKDNVFQALKHTATSPDGSPISPTPAASDPDAAAIIRKVQARYATLKSYSDSGEVISTHEQLAPAGKEPFEPTTFRTAFAIRLQRPNQYRIQWEQKVNDYRTDRGAAWSAGNGDFLFKTGMDTPRRERDRGRALAMADAPASHTIPYIFFNAPVNNLTVLSGWQTRPEATVDGENCHVLDGFLGTRKTTFWISKKTLLIRQVQTISDPNDPSPAIPDQALKAMLEAQHQKATPEAVAREKRRIEAGQTLIKGIRLTTREIHRSIVVNVPLDHDEFLYQPSQAPKSPGRTTQIPATTEPAHPTPPPPAADDAAIAAAEKWLAMVDEGRYAESWKQAAALFRQAIPESQWGQALTALRKPLGKTLSRTVLTRQFTTSMPGAPDGQYVVIQFKTSFEHKNEAVETVTPMKEKDGNWKVSGYYIK